MLQRLKVEVINHGIFAEHNMPCAVCTEESAVLNLNIGIFEPCWRCQSLGWTLAVKRKKWFKRG